MVSDEERGGDARTGLTVGGVDARPHRQALPNDTRASTTERCTNNGRDLDGVRVRDAGFDERVLRDTIHRRRENDVRPNEALLIRINHTQVDGAVEGGLRDGLELLDIHIAVDGVRRVFAPRVIREDTRARLYERSE